MGNPNDPIQIVAPSPMKAYVWDLETTGLRSDIATIIAAAFLDVDTGEVFAANINDFKGDRPARREKQLVKWISDFVIEADILIGHNSDGFDKNLLNGVRSRHDLPKLPKRLHIDTMQAARYGWKGLPQSYSLENLADFFRLDILKDKPSKHDWRDSIVLDEDAINRITVRCVEDVKVTALLWDKLRTYYYEWRGK